MRPVHYSPLYRELRSIDPKDYQRIIRVYEEKERRIGQLDPEEYFDLTVRYVDALFATGAHRRHLLMVDLVIFASIDRNIRLHEGQDVYQRMLFRKAASAYRIRDFAGCAHVCRELMRMYPEQKHYPQLLRRALFQQQRNTLQFGRGAAIFCFLLTALVIVLDLLVVKNFYPREHQAFLWLRNDVFFIGVLVLLGSVSLAWWRASRRVSRYQSEIRKRTS